MGTNPKLRLIVGGVVVEGAQVALRDLPKPDQGGASELMNFLGGAKRVLILYKPVVYAATGSLESQYLVVRQDQIQACEFVTPSVAETDSVDHFRWEWDD